MSTSPSTLPNVETAAAWKQEVNDRLAAHRTRRTRRDAEHPRLPGLDSADAGDHPKSSIAARVAARYAQAPTYSEMLAAEAQNAATAAAAAARAAGQAQAAAQAILTGLDLRHDAATTQSQDHPGTAGSAGRQRQHPRQQIPQKAETGRNTGTETRREPWQDAHLVVPDSDEFDFRHEAKSLHTSGPAGTDFRIDFADHTDAYSAIEHDAPPQPITANLIEFPRELFATRRARPRVAEGPLREEPGQESGRPQLRIFEVEADAISTVATVATSHAEWAPIRLGAHPVVDEMAEQKAAVALRPQRSMAAGSHAPATNQLELPLQTATLEDRTMAAVFDFIAVTAAFLLFVAAFVACSAAPPVGKPALMAALAVYFVIAMGYQLLFFGFAESTPGMRYAKIALCTFDDENPTRKQMRIRVATMLLSLCPLGLGCAWIFFDEDHLSWHDRITRTYQRSYR